MFSVVANEETLLARCLRVLGDELSLKLLHALGNGPAACADLARQLQCNHQVVRRRLEALRKAGFVQRSKRHGYKGKALYTACIEKVRALFALAMSCVGITESPG